eukprot:438322-Pelagomonas_calceolata.AAC.1
MRQLVRWGRVCFVQLILASLLTLKLHMTHTERLCSPESGCMHKGKVEKELVGKGRREPPPTQSYRTERASGDLEVYRTAMREG